MAVQTEPEPQSKSGFLKKLTGGSMLMIQSPATLNLDTGRSNERLAPLQSICTTYYDSNVGGKILVIVPADSHDCP